MEPLKNVSNAFQVFASEAPEYQQAWMEMIMKLGQQSALDKKTGQLAYIAVLAAIGLTSGIPFHVQMAKNAGASREEIISAVLTGLPAAGHIVTQALPVALQTFDSI
jgi:alkylhydroperoxidase/carboxymuconolactone decarboxylase family protein YurZ